MGRPACSEPKCPHTVAAYRQVNGERRGLCLRHMHAIEVAPMAFFRHAEGAPRPSEPKREPEIIVENPVQRMKPPPSPPPHQAQPKQRAPVKAPAPISDVKAVSVAERHATMQERDDLALAWIRAEVEAGRPFPTRVQIAERVGWEHPFLASCCLKRLIEAGHVYRVGRQGFALVDPDSRQTILVMMGMVLDALSLHVAARVGIQTSPAEAWRRGAEDLLIALHEIGIDLTPDQLRAIVSTVSQWPVKEA